MPPKPTLPIQRAARQQAVSLVATINLNNDKMKKTKIIVEKFDEKEADNYDWYSDTPSKITDGYWVFAHVKKEGNRPRRFKNNKIGKWLVFVDIGELDKTWKIIKNATEKNYLGHLAKAATAKQNSNASSEREKVICIYTYNWQDTEDVYRVEKELRNIGIETTLYYKTDLDTTEDKYSVNGSKNISKYISKAIKSYKKFSLESLNGIGYEKTEILKNIGIENLDDLLSFDTSKKLERVGVTIEYINKIKLLALSQVENMIYRLNPFIIPTGEIVHFDIETDLYTTYNTKRVWSIAVHHKNKVIPFLARRWEEEKKILTDFLNYIKGLENPILFSYSGHHFDKNVLEYAFIRHGLDTDYFLNCKHYDLCTILKQHYIFPVKSYGLKEIGKYLGYKYSNPDLNGLYVAQKYMRCQEMGKKLSIDILLYIIDDVKVMEHIITQIQIIKNIKDIFDYSNEE